MTWEEMERTMAFIREQQAHLDAPMERLSKRADCTPAKATDTAEKVDSTPESIDHTHERILALLAAAKKRERERRKRD
jgi:hypothetical protein